MFAQQHINISIVFNNHVLVSVTECGIWVRLACSIFHIFSRVLHSAIIVNECTAIGIYDASEICCSVLSLMGTMFRHKGGGEVQVVNSWPVTCKQTLVLV